MSGTRFTCPGCGTVMTSANPLPVGRSVRCYRCGGTFTIADEEPQVALNPFAPLDTGSVEPSFGQQVSTGDPASPADSRPARRDDSWEDEPPRNDTAILWKLLSWAIVLCLSIAAGILTYALIPPQYEERAVQAPAQTQPRIPDRKPTAAKPLPPNLMQTDDELPDWKPDPELVDQLASEISLPDFPGFSIRPPQGYVFQTASDVFRPMKGFAWNGPTRADGTRPIFMVAMSNSPPGERVSSAQKALDACLRPVRNEHQNLMHTSPERGEIHGLPCMRCRWYGIDRASQRKMHGFCYAIVNAKTVIYLIGQDAEPYNEKTLQLIEVSVLTLRKR